MKKLGILLLYIGVVWLILSTILFTLFITVATIISLMMWEPVVIDAFFDLLIISTIFGALGATAMIIYDRKGFMEIVNEDYSD